MNVILASYAGPSMNPTLREPEIIEILPYGGRPLQAGDVAFFLSPETAQPVVHRIIRVTPEGLSTAGDNNTREDAFLLQPHDVQGRVVGAWRGRRRRRIAGGFRGRLTSRWLRWRRMAGQRLSHPLHSLYDGLSRGGLIARFLPAPLRPRVVVFHTKGHDRFRLLLGQRIIGRYDARTRQWQIPRPYRLIVDERVLPRQPDGQRTGPGCVIEDRRS